MHVARVSWRLLCVAVFATVVLSLGLRTVKRASRHSTRSREPKSPTQDLWKFLEGHPPEVWIVYAQLTPERVWPEIRRRAQSLAGGTLLEQAIEAVAWGGEKLDSPQAVEARAWLRSRLVFHNAASDAMWRFHLAETESFAMKNLVPCATERSSCKRTESTDQSTAPNVACNNTPSTASARCEAAHGQYYTAKGNHVKALQAFHRASHLCNLLAKPYALCDHTLYELGAGFGKMGWGVKAFTILTQCFRRAQEVGDLRMESRCSLALGESLIHEGDLGIGIQYLNRSINIETFVQNDMCFIVPIAKRVAGIYLNKNLCKQAEPFLNFVAKEGVDCLSTSADPFQSWRALLHLKKCKILQEGRLVDVQTLYNGDMEHLTHGQRVEVYTVLAETAEHLHMLHAAIAYYHSARTEAMYLNVPHELTRLSSKILDLILRNTPALHGVVNDQTESELNGFINEIVVRWKR